MKIDGEIEGITNEKSQRNQKEGQKEEEEMQRTNILKSIENNSKDLLVK